MIQRLDDLRLSAVPLDDGRYGLEAVQRALERGLANAAGNRFGAGAVQPFPETRTRAPMAIVQAEEGGIGIIDRGFRPGDIQPQVREVEIVKRTQHGVISDPYSVPPSATIEQAAALMARSRVGTLVVLDDERHLKG